MVDEGEKIIWFIDNDPSQLDTYHRQLERGLQAVLDDDGVEIVDVIARPHKEDYLDILENARTAAILIDQKLEDKGGVDHTGIELAQYLRTLDEIMPIYILTNFPSIDDYGEGEWSVEDILSKNGLSNETKRHAILSRILRRINVHRKIYSEREARFRELLQKSMKDELTDDEKMELDELEFSRSASTIAYEHLQQAKPDKMDEVLSQLEDLRKSLIDTVDDDIED